MEARRGDRIDFGEVGSCMTITCRLQDGRLVATHLSAPGEPRNGQRDARLALLTERWGHLPVTSVLVAGSRSAWTPRLVHQTDLVCELIEQDPTFASAGWQEQLERMKPHLVRGHERGLCERIAQALAVPPDRVHFMAHDEGPLSVRHISAPRLGASFDPPIWLVRRRASCADEQIAPCF